MTLKGETFHSLPFPNPPIDEKLQRTIPPAELSMGPLKCAQQSLLQGMQVSGCANPEVLELARTKGAGCQSPLQHSRAASTLARALQHPWSTYLLALTQGNCFDTQFIRSGRFALCVHLWIIVPTNKSQPALIELH